MTKLPRLITFDWAPLRASTAARIGLDRAGHAVTTRNHLAFQGAHAAARDAVHGALDPAPLLDGLHAAGLDSVLLHSAAGNRSTYLARPDMGRRLDPPSRERL